MRTHRLSSAGFSKESNINERPIVEVTQDVNRKYIYQNSSTRVSDVNSLIAEGLRYYYGAELELRFPIQQVLSHGTMKG